MVELATALIALREGFEAALLVSVVASYLKRVGETRLVTPLLAGSLFGVLLSLVLSSASGALRGLTVEEEFLEAAGAFVAVPVLTWVVYWMSSRGGRVLVEVRSRARASAGRGGLLPMAALGFTLVLREGVEVALFTLPLTLTDPLGAALGAAVGAAAAVAMAYPVYAGGVRLDLRRFFYLTSLLLIAIAGGVLGRGVHELVEYGEEAGWRLGILAEPVYRLPLEEGSVLHHEGLVGGVLAVLFGYSTEMELIRFVVQLGYLAVGLGMVARAYRRTEPES